MAFWKRKKKESSELEPVASSGAFKDLTDSINLSTQTTERSIKAFHEMTKALNNATREMKKR
jgi:hypothetical protein